jgi:arylformamidase
MRQCLMQNREQVSDECRSEIRERMEQRMQMRQQRGEGLTGEQRTGRGEWRGRGERAGRGLGQYASARPDATILYGAHQRQQIDIFTPEDAMGEAPLIVFVHGGGWTRGSHKMVAGKPGFFTEQGYAFASAGYRVLPEAPVEQQAADLGEALRALRAQAETSGFDPDTIILMGHSAGAHLAALIAADPKYAGDAFGAIKGAVLIDGAGYDIPLASTMPEMELPLLYRDVFGTDPERHKALSPITHVGGRDAPNWLILHVEERAPAKAQAQGLAAALGKAGRQVEVLSVTGSDHRRINQEIGTDKGAVQTQAVDAFLKRVTAH